MARFELVDKRTGEMLSSKDADQAIKDAVPAEWTLGQRLRCVAIVGFAIVHGRTYREIKQDFPVYSEVVAAMEKRYTLWRVRLAARVV